MEQGGIVAPSGQHRASRDRGGMAASHPCAPASCLLSSQLQPAELPSSIGSAAGERSQLRHHAKKLFSSYCKKGNPISLNTLPNHNVFGNYEKMINRTFNKIFTNIRSAGLEAIYASELRCRRLSSWKRSCRSNGRTPAHRSRSSGLLHCITFAGVCFS